ncbi:CMRF35-like molecule 5 [Colossoma macropomum]|uniref:CMRF35-like molecule 5 n=1 Tax=Colossoma macropomum TaxID=42526 RepID=UPI001864C52E|nr:CMRF35-like molecule 5 [Colossoma macropomum]
MSILLTSIICTLTVLGSIMANTFTLEGHVGGQIQIRCSHGNAHKNIKYFCNAECETDEDILIKSARNRNPNTRGRYSLSDKGSGVFIVTISNLKKSDSGIYWCAVERPIKDTYRKVILTVLEAPKPTSRTTPTLSDWSTSKGTEVSKMADSDTSFKATPVKTTTTANSSDKSDNKQLIYIGAGLAALVLLFVIFLFILIKQSKQRKAAVQQTEKAQHTENVAKYSSAKTSSSVNQRTTPSIRDNPTANRRPQSDPSSTVYANFTPAHDSLSYATVSFANQSDDLNYSNVMFVKKSDANTSHPKKSEVDTARSSSPLYSTVNPTNSSHSDQDTNAVIYSTVQKAK